MVVMGYSSVNVLYANELVRKMVGLVNFIFPIYNLKKTKPKKKVKNLLEVQFTLSLGLKSEVSVALPSLWTTFG